MKKKIGITDNAEVEVCYKDNWDYLLILDIDQAKKLVQNLQRVILALHHTK